MRYNRKLSIMVSCFILTLTCNQLLSAEEVEQKMIQTPDAATTVVEKYFSLMREGNMAVIDLFHPKALLLGLGRRTEGHEAIKKFYTYAIASGGPQPRNAGPLLSDGSRVAAEIYIDLSSGATLHVIDLFTIKEGRIVSLNYFLADEPPAK